MKPEITSLKKFREILAFMNLPVFSYIDSDDFAIIKIRDMGLKMPYLTPIFRPGYYTLTIIQAGEIVVNAIKGFILINVFNITTFITLLFQADSVSVLRCL